MPKNNIIKINNDIVVKEEGNLDDFLKPFSQEILLFTTKIANTYKVPNQVALLELKVGDLLSFKLGNSKYENNLIEIYNSSSILVGYVPEADSIIFARLMNAGKKLGAKVKSLSQSRNVPLIEIDIYLTDF